jgi:hypothetical protein
MGMQSVKHASFFALSLNRVNNLLAIPRAEFLVWWVVIVLTLSEKFTRVQFSEQLKPARY